MDVAKIREAARRTKQDFIEVLLREWPEGQVDAGKITDQDCEKWARDFSKQYSATRFNGTLSTVRHIFKVAIKAGARYDDPTRNIKRMRVRSKIPALLSREQFNQLLEIMEAAGGCYSQKCADFVRFLAYTGCRLSEAIRVTWNDIDFERGEITVRGDEVTGTKNWEIRRVPMIPECRNMLERLFTGQPSSETVMPIRECQNSINRATAFLNIPRFTHHDLRHLFAARCIESDVDIPTVARWLGHKDGGALAMKTYGHLRDEHSKAAAQKVKF